jgi:hypothetical protein
MKPKNPQQTTDFLTMTQEYANESDCLAERSMELTIYREVDDRLWFRSAVVRHTGASIRVNFVNKPTLIEIFRKEALNFIESLCTYAKTEKQVISLPEIDFTIGAVLARGCSIFVHRKVQGIMQIVIRIKSLIGNPMSFFRSGVLQSTIESDVGGVLSKIAQEKILEPVSEFSNIVGYHLERSDALYASRRMQEIQSVIESQSLLLQATLKKLLEDTRRDCGDEPSKLSG